MHLYYLQYNYFYWCSLFFHVELNYYLRLLASSLRSFPHIPVLFRALNKVTVQRPMEMAKIIQAELLIILLSANEHVLRRACAKALGWMPGNGGE